VTKSAVESTRPPCPAIRERAVPGEYLKFFSKISVNSVAKN
jgi:hypothetical protein